MKKIIVMLLALAILLGLAACVKPVEGGDSSSAPESSEKSPESSTEGDSGRIDLPYTVPLSDTEKYTVETAWKDKFGEEMVWFDKDAEELDYEAVRYYGYFSGYLVFFDHIGWNLEYECALQISNLTFVHDEMFEIYAYKDGKFYEIQTAYESEKLTYGDVGILAMIHEKFESYIKMYSAE